ncbi:MAG: hypothetical protein JO153_17055 [Solirubrobacterales bacterium]|nr:hypothetical protein [Solirubrobacterales bacterium]MBV9918212.1 hypothetical protein [Solirubrobacterales bacterium]
MSSDDQAEFTKPTEQRTGAAPGEEEAREKGPWAATAGEGVVPAELGGSDAPADLQDEDPELGSESLGRSAASTEPATESGIDRSAGDNADATTQGGPEPPSAAEPDLRDAATGPRQVDVNAAQ